MPEFPPDSPDDEAVSTALLEQLRAESGAGLEFVDATVRLTGGFETFTYGFRVSAERETPAVCHGDFHPGNVMVDDGAVSGVIDWPGASFADAEHDVAVTLVLVGVVAGGVFPEAGEMLQSFRSAYLEAYEQRRALDHGLLEYYEVMRAFTSFVRGTAAVTPGVNADLLPRGGYPWADG